VAGLSDGCGREKLRSSRPIEEFLSLVVVNDSALSLLSIMREVFETVRLQPIGYKFAFELLVKCDTRFIILEFPIIFQKRKMGSSKTGVKEGIKIMTLILALWIWKISHKH
jgi:hypothetical protein